jgi:DNA-binding transcriptional MerR regulator
MTHWDAPESVADAHATTAKAPSAPDDAVAPALYPIGRLAQEAGVSTRTVRYYEEIGLLRVARRYAGGRRVFDSDALQRLHFISRLKGLGFSLEEIRHLNDVFELNRSTADMLVVLDNQLEAHLATLEQRMRELAALRNDITEYRAHIRARRQVLA